MKSEKKDGFYYLTDDEISISKCVKYFEKGKILHSWESKYEIINVILYLKKIVFANKGKTYLLLLSTKTEIGTKDNPAIYRQENLDKISCERYDFDKE